VESAMSFLWLPYFPAPHEWHDEGMPLFSSKDKMKQKIKDLYKEVRRKVNCVTMLFYVYIPIQSLRIQREIATIMNKR